jgi:hypothetical protein
MRLMDRIVILHSMRLLIDSSDLTRRLILDFYFVQFSKSLLASD